MTTEERLELEKEALNCIYRRIVDGVDGDLPNGVRFYLYPDGLAKVEKGQAFLTSQPIDDDGGFFVFTVAYMTPKR